jgi:methylated-DNA-[protein]-cysteine S-methyltransferase
MQEIYIYNSPIGFLELIAKNEKLQFINFTNNAHQTKNNLSNFMKFCTLELNAYFEKKLKNFSIPYEFFTGTQFQQNVWGNLKKIDYGKVISYKELAIKIKNEKAYRAVGNANSKNPLPILLPCHRVIGANNKLGGYSGGLDKKTFLLNLEGIYI